MQAPDQAGTFSDPLAQRTLAEATLEDQIRRHHGACRVLVVDDLELNLEITRLLLHRIGLRVDTALNGREAVDMARTTAYALVFMDIQMPEMDGLAAARAIRQLPRRAGTPILAITANAFAEHRRQCLDEGMDDFIAKPIDADTLYAAVAKWLLPADATAKAQAAERGETIKADVTPLPSPSAATAGMSLRQKLAGVVGLDAESGLGRVRGNEDKYAQVIGLFLRGHECDAGKIADALLGSETIAAEQLIHALKGTAGLIGASAVAGAAATLLARLHEKSARAEIEQGYADLALRLGQLIEGLNSVQDWMQDRAPESATGQQADMARGEELLRVLESLLANGDLAARALARGEDQLLRAMLGAAAESILSAIEVFDYAHALAELQAAKSQRPGRGGE